MQFYSFKLRATEMCVLISFAQKEIAKDDKL